ncbi:MAG: 3-methyl-2-oxobutanoate hydroxymethyltransferase [Legionellales bacterium]|nr:3-methyl-2-oxobutanoate hydroxymethyltransferase [Legionellales bacterium]
MNIHDWQLKKDQQQKISMVTAYDATFAKLIEQTEINSVLVGDSVAMVAHGYPNTTHATMAMMVMHTQAVARGIQTKFIVTDLPFMSYRQSWAHTCRQVQRLMQAGAHAVKLEGAQGNYATIEQIVTSGVSVMGHLGLTPQTIHQLGGHKVQGKNKNVANQLLAEAQSLKDAGCFALVLECIPWTLAKKITQAIAIPTIGIGAGPYTDGQILVLYDLLGLQEAFKPKFLKQYLAGETGVIQAINQYVAEVGHQQFPTVETHSYHD